MPSGTSDSQPAVSEEKTLPAIRSLPGPACRAGPNSVTQVERLLTTFRSTTGSGSAPRSCSYSYSAKRYSYSIPVTPWDQSCFVRYPESACGLAGFVFRCPPRCSAGSSQQPEAIEKGPSSIFVAAHPVKRAQRSENAFWPGFSRHGSGVQRTRQQDFRYNMHAVSSVPRKADFSHQEKLLSSRTRLSSRIDHLHSELRNAIPFGHRHHALECAASLKPAGRILCDRRPFGPTKIGEEPEKGDKSNSCMGVSIEAKSVLQISSARSPFCTIEWISAACRKKG